MSSRPKMWSAWQCVTSTASRCLRPTRSACCLKSEDRSEEHTSELQSHRDLHSFPTRRSSDLYVVEAEDVVGVAVCDEHRVKVFEADAQRLLPEVGRRVDENLLAPVFDQHGDAQTLVARVVRSARLAPAADGRHARRSARAE